MALPNGAGGYQLGDGNLLKRLVAVAEISIIGLRQDQLGAIGHQRPGDIVHGDFKANQGAQVFSGHGEDAVPTAELVISRNHPD